MSMNTSEWLKQAAKRQAALQQGAPTTFWRDCWRAYKASLPQRLMEFFGMMSLLVIGVLMFAWLFDNGWLPDTPQQHEQRLSCEQTQMLGGNLAGIRMSASDAEAFCDKLMQEQKIYDANHKP